MSLLDVCYEQIKDNFCYGLFGDFKLIIDKSTGYFNATKLCKDGGKQFKHWLENKHSKELIAYMSSAGIPAADHNEPLKFVTGGDCEVIRGTYVPEELILSIASWISSAFYVKCNKVIINYYIRNFKQCTDDSGQLQAKVQEIEKSMSKLSLENSKLKPIAAPYTDNPMLHNCFVICLKNNSDPFPYHAIRIQRKNLSRALKDLRTKYPDYIIVYQKLKDPNSIKLFRLMQEELDIKCFRNDFTTSLTEEDLIEKIDNLYDKNF